MKSDIKYILNRVEKLNETAKELKSEFKKTKNPLLEDLYLEIECYTREIENRIKKMGKKNGQ
jgi:peptidoglycan hydrolase CwlO-like protein